jgi:hypothetical protein
MQFIAWNSASAITAARAGVLTGTAIKTMLQIATPATRSLRVVRWGVRFDSAPTVIVRCELMTSTAVAATSLTAHAAPGVQPYDRASGTPVSLMTLGTGATGFGPAGAGAEGTITVARSFDEWVTPIGVSTYDYEWSLGREPEVPPSNFLRVRMTTATTIAAQCYIVWDE